ncbi:alpha-ketoglutarate-dependent taurine dioxygenase [Nitrosomonas sp. Nm84]|uniref:TauD/TfdA family dioxygenase n=1 Tax=Nitrosomonas sp. Nm84 TaxID=200124 RepID=UPI000D80AFA3|nr:TauD/TfdA family dioxygenase [Nitrosomonas sp. Nm84]PXW80424.1 alpha-ketoglutarate-dependent taurine dioxygenase [Nitrosomonas sp. Nm84]
MSKKEIFIIEEASLPSLRLTDEANYLASDYLNKAIDSEQKEKTKSFLYKFRLQILDYIKSEGIVVIENFPCNSDSENVLNKIGSVIGIPIKYEHQYALIMDITPDINNAGDLPGYNSSERFDLHTDLSFVENPPDIVCLYVVRQDINHDAESLFCNPEKILFRLDKSLLEELQLANYLFKSPEYFQGIIDIRHSVISKSEEKYHVRFRKDMMQSLTWKSYLTAEYFWNEIQENAIEYMPKENSLIFINNKTSMHGRSKFESSHDRNNDRLLKRLYINLDIKRRDNGL